MKVKIKKESVRFMYCPNCNQYNDDQNRFCAFCGTPLQKQQTEMPNTGSYQSQQPQSFGAPDEGSYQPQQSYQQPQQGYEQPQAPYQQTWQPPQSELTKPISMATPVVSLILNIVFFNPVGLILAVLSLLNFNNYTSEKNRGAMENAETAHKLNPSDRIVAQRMNSLEAQYAAKQRSEQAAAQKTAVAKAEFVDVPVSSDALPVQTAPVQTTSAKAQENSDAQPAELVVPEAQPAPTTNFQPVPKIDAQISQSQPIQVKSDPQNDAALGFGNPVASGGQTASNSDRRVNRVKDDSDVKWISSSNADRVRNMIAQTGATSPQDAANNSGFPVVSSDGTGSPSQKLPNKTVTTAQFETPAFAQNAAHTASAATASQPSAPQATTVNATSESPQVVSTPAPEKEIAKPRAELHSGPPRVSAGSFF